MVVKLRCPICTHILRGRDNLKGFGGTCQKTWNLWDEGDSDRMRRCAWYMTGEDYGFGVGRLPFPVLEAIRYYERSKPALAARISENVCDAVIKQPRADLYSIRTKNHSTDFVRALVDAAPSRRYCATDNTWVVSDRDRDGLIRAVYELRGIVATPMGVAFTDSVKEAI